MSAMSEELAEEGQKRVRIIVAANPILRTR